MSAPARNPDRKIPDQVVLNELLRYEPETGKLFWRTRSARWFTEAAHTAKHRANNWNSRYAEREAFTMVTLRGYRGGSVLGRHFTAHRIIWKMITGEEPPEIDHIDGNKVSNRWANLRACYANENKRNMPMFSTNKSGVVGVFSRDGKWSATIHANGVRESLGLFLRKDDAVAARKAAERRHGFHPNHGRAKNA